MKAALLVALAGLAAPVANASDASLAGEVVAIRAELERGLESLRLESAPAPYFAEVRLVRAAVLGIGAAYGGIVTDVYEPQSTGTLSLRIGSPTFDNTGYFGGDGGAVRLVIALDPAPAFTRRRTWWAMDNAFRAAAKTFSQKRAILDRLASTDETRDFGPPPEIVEHLVGSTEPVQLDVDRTGLATLAAQLSARFRDWPSIDNGEVHVQILKSHEVLVTTEGVALDWIRERAVLAVLADTQLDDGMRIDHGAAIHLQSVPRPDQALSEAGEELVDRVLRELDELAAAPMIEEEYDGPILLVGPAAAQFLAATLVTQASGMPPALGDSGRMIELEPGLQRRIGKTVLPPFLDVIDDPGGDGFGSYDYDAQGFRPSRKVLVEGGQLNTLLMTRSPNPYLAESNGRARSTPALEVGSSISNLTLESRRRGWAPPQLERELLERAREDGYEFAYVVELLRDGTLLGAIPRDSASTFAGTGKIQLPLPARVFRVDAQGVRTLVRGAMFAPVSPRVLRRIRGVGRRDHTEPMRIAVGPNGGFGVQLGMDGVLSQTVDVQVTTPDLLVEGLELLVERGEHERPPILVHPLRRELAKASADSGASPERSDAAAGPAPAPRVAK